MFAMPHDGLKPDGLTPDGLTPFVFPEFETAPSLLDGREQDVESGGEDIELPLQIELGRTRLDQAVLSMLREGSAIPLDKRAGHSMDVYADGRLVARGELLVMDGKFCVRITERLIHEEADSN
jgi:flagellar motor switch protein FliN